MSGCAPPVSTLELGLGEAPADVASLTAWVVDVAAGRTVASATVTPSTRAIPLEVPAERPLEVRVVARSTRPAPAPYERMVVYVGGARTEVPLVREATHVKIGLSRAGLLSVDWDGKTEVAPELEVVLRPVGLGEPRSARIEAGRPRRWTVALPIGRYRLDPGDPDLARLGASEGLWVTYAAESRHRVHVLPPGPPEVVELAVLGADDRELSRVAPGQPFAVQVALDPPGEASARVSILGDDGGLRAELELPTLPGRIDGVVLDDPGRVRIRAELERGGFVHVRTRPLDVREGAPGAPTRASLWLDRRGLEDRDEGELSIELLDAAGFAAHGDFEVDLEGSDPWLVFEGGPRVRSGPSGVAEARVLRPSRPLALPLAIRAVLTTTAGASFAAEVGL